MSVFSPTQLIILAFLLVNQLSFAQCNGTDIVPPTASNPLPISVPGASSVPLPDPLVVTDEADDITTEPIVAWVSDISDGNTCDFEVITRTYSITDECGNQILVTQQITILAVYPPIDAGADQSICAGQTVTLTAGNPWNVPISWNPVNPPVNGQPFIPVGTGTYTVTANNEGCITTDDVTITVEELPNVDFSADFLSGCAPLTVEFTNLSTGPTPLVDCAWDFGGATSTDCASAIAIFETSGQYDVTLTTTSSTGCVNSTTYSNYISVEEVPEASFNPSSTDLTTLDTEVDFENTSTGATDYVWSFGDETASTTVENPTHIFPVEESASFLVTLVASEGECADTALMYINIEEDVIYYMPNTFTPDGDAYNQTFRPVFSSGYDPYDFTLFIFNRWGEVVWESHDTSVGWDGTYNGRKLSSGTYNWKLEFKTTATDERRMAVGHVNLLN